MGADQFVGVGGGAFERGARGGRAAVAERDRGVAQQPAPLRARERRAAKSFAERFLVERQQFIQLRRGNFRLKAKCRV